MDKLSFGPCLITGATGFVGQHLAARLAQKAQASQLAEHATQTAAPVYALVRDPAAETATALPDGITAVRGDLATLTPDFWTACGITAFETVFHLAAFTPKNARDAQDRRRNLAANIVGTQNLLESLPPVRRLVFASTLDVYAPPAEGATLDETALTQPATLYGWAKLYAEAMVKQWAAETNTEWAILRYGHLFGPGEEAYQKLIPVTLRRFLAGERPMIYGNPEALRDFLFVGDAVEATLRAAQSDAPALGPVNIVRGASATVREVVALLSDLTGNRQAPETMPTSTVSPSFRFSAALMDKLLGSWPKVSLADGLRQEIAHLSGHLKTKSNKGKE